MAFPLEAAEEGLRTAALLGGAAYLAWRGRREDLARHPGLALVLVGLWILSFGSLIDLADEFAAYGRLPASLVAEPYGAFELMSEFVAPEMGTLLMLAGIVLWLPLPRRLDHAEGALQRANDELRQRADAVQRSWDALLANAPDYVLLIDEDERVAFANRTPDGLTVAQVVGQPIAGFVPDPGQRQALTDAIRAALADGPATTLELEGPGPGGSLASYACRVAPARTAAGKPAALMLNSDITQARRARSELLAREALLHETQEIARVGSWEVDLQTGEQHGTPEARRLFGLRGHESETQGNLLAHIHPEDRARVVDAMAAAAHGHAELTCRVVHPDGSVHWVRSTAEARCDAAGRPVRIVGFSQDVTQERMREEALRASEERWRSLAENAPAYIVTCDTDGHITFVNRALEGMPVSDILGRHAWDFVPPEAVDAVRDGLRSTLMDGKPCTMETQATGPNGSLRWYAVHWSPVRAADGQVHGAIGMAFDVTEQRRAIEDTQAARRLADERQREAERLRDMTDFKTQFLNNAAHELATPLTPLKLQLATMRPLLAARDPAGFELLERNVNRLGALVNDLLDAARLQSGHLRLQADRVRVAELLARVVLSFRPQAQEAGVTLGVHPASEDLALVCDEMRIEQVLFNLVHNAIKFTPRGGQVWVRAEADGQQVALAVQDTGIGMTVEQAARLFQPFTQVHDAGQVRTGGTGLGLYIAHGIAQQHGGELRVQSAGAGCGTTFTVRLPRGGPAPEALAATPRRA